MEADTNNNNNSCANNSSKPIQRRGKLVKKLTDVKSFISDHVRIRGRTRSVPGGLDDRVNRAPSWKINRHFINRKRQHYSVQNVSSGAASDAYLNGHFRKRTDHTNGSLPYLASNNDECQEVVFEISDDETDEWLTPYPTPIPTPIPTPTPPILYGSLDHFQKRKIPNNEEFHSVDNVKTRTKKSEESLINNGNLKYETTKKRKEKNIFKFGSFSYNVECSSSATDIHKVDNKEDDTELFNKGIVERSFSDAHVYNQNTLPPFNNLAKIKQQNPIGTTTEMTYNSLDRNKTRKFKFEERKRRVPFSLNFNSTSFKNDRDKTGSRNYSTSSNVSIDEVPNEQQHFPFLGSYQETKIVAKVSIDSDDGQTSLVRYNSTSSCSSPVSPTPSKFDFIVNNEAPIIVKVDPKTLESARDINDAPIVVKLDATVFDDQNQRKTSKTDTSNVKNSVNKTDLDTKYSQLQNARKQSHESDREKKKTDKPEPSNQSNNSRNSESSCTNASDNQSNKKSGFWDDETFQLDDNYIRKIIEREAGGVIADKEYDEKKVTSWIKEISGNVREKVRAYTGRGYKIVVNSFIGSMVPSDIDTISMSVRSCTDTNNDHFIVCAFENESLFVSVTLLLLQVSFIS